MTGFYKDYQDASDTHENSAESYATDASNSANAAAQSAAAASSSATASAQAVLDHENLQVTTATFSLANGILKLIKANDGEVVVSLDGRYAELTGADFTGDVSIPSAGELQSEGSLNLRFNSEDNNSSDTFNLHYDDSDSTAMEVNSLGNVFIGTGGTGSGNVPKSFNKLAVGSMGIVSASNATVGIKANSSYQALAMQANGTNSTVKFNVLDNGTLNIGTPIATNLSLTYGGDLTVLGTIEGRDVAYDGSKLDTIEPAADVTDATNVTAAGAAMLTGADFTGGVTTTGDVGIGTDSPAYNLVVNDTASSVIQIRSGNDDAGHLYFADTGDDNIGGVSYSHEYNFMGFKTNDTERLRIDATGKVGIGTDTPAQALHVVGNIAVSGTVDGRDVLADGTKLDLIEANADVTDTANVTAAGALMDSEVTNLAQVKAFDSSDYATAAQGSTADSALQNLIEDTTPQLGGDLDLNGNDITGTGNISITQSSTSTPALHIYNADTSDVASPTIRLDRKSTTTVDDDSIGKIEFYGWKESIPPFFPTAEYANITGVINDGSDGTIDGQLDFNLAKDNTLTTVMSLSSTALELPNGTDLVVTGTVDGRDIATDGTKLDGIDSGATESYNYSNQIHGTYTNLTTSIAQIGSDFYLRNYSDNYYKRFLEFSAYMNYFTTSSTNDLNVRIMLVVPSSSGNAVDVGSVETVVATGQYNRQITLDGDVTHWFSDYAGIGVNSNGATPFASIVTSVYNASTDKTILEVSTYAATLPSVGDSIYVHPFDWETTNSELVGNVKQYDAKAGYSSTYTINDKVYFGNINRFAACRIKMSETASSDSVNVQRIRIHQTDERT